MKGARGFRYSLEPVRAMRSWAVDACRAELAELGASMSALERRLHQLALLQQSAAAQSRSAGQQPVGIDLFLRLQAYGADLERQARSQKEALARLEEERESAVARLNKAQRALEAVDEHRDNALARHGRDAASREYAVADDQWNCLQWRSKECT